MFPSFWNHGDRCVSGSTCCGAGRDRSAGPRSISSASSSAWPRSPRSCQPGCWFHPGSLSAHPELAERFEIVTGSRMTGTRGGRLFAEAFTDSAQFADVDVVHHAGGTLPLRHRRHPTLLTVHDVQYLAAPHYFSAARRTYLRTRVPRSVHRATGDRRAQPLRGTHVGRCFRHRSGEDRRRAPRLRPTADGPAGRRRPASPVRTR